MYKTVIKIYSLILGTQPFCDLELITKPPVFIPRLETEDWIGRLIALLKPHFSTTTNLALQKGPFKIIDICTGSAMRSCKKLHNQVEFFHLDIMKSTDKQICEFMSKSNGYDLVVSNPPYISHDEYLTLDEDIKLWEDKLAFLSDENGTMFHSKISYLAAKYLLKKIVTFQLSGRTRYQNWLWNSWKSSSI
ncbi:hypothetical protein C2G38_2038708 [Gigaspora rosea]|uniref:S-adenosyl-L-methionine-dependent methyltransferase n=1 Tax=Gigaspora rosea TaxID=44941 RepID=A0A397V5Q8_9GLOM|nr:hypothetical protein C2G38_2038708 [Gigaspora rosea]